VIGLGIILVLNSVGISYAFGRQEALVLEPHISALQALLISLLVLLVAILATLQPAWKASKMQPIDALRHV
jgi:putative ABC transport system permease protein